jgi:GDP-L-fucose synthase
MILVSGGGGPLGLAFKEVVKGQKDYCFPNSKECNLELAESIDIYTSKNELNLNGIIHLAAFSGGASLSRMKPAEMISRNLMMAINVLEFARKSGIKRVLLCISTSAYSPKIDSPKETDLHSHQIEGIDYAYSWAKRSMEPLMRAFNEQYGMEVICVVINGIIGPGMNFREGEMILPAALIKKFSVSTGNTPPNLQVLTDGSEIREYSASSDIAKAVLWCYKNQPPSTILNIGSSEKVTVRRVAELIATFLNLNPLEIVYGDKTHISRPIQSTDNRKFIGLSNFKYISIEDTIKLAVEWYVSENRNST